MSGPDSPPGAASQDGRKPRLLGMDAAQIPELADLAPLPPFRVRQIATWIFERGITSFDEMTDLPKDLRARLAQGLDVSTDPVVRKTSDPDGEATKFLLQLHDGGLIESVLIEGRKRKTFCVSSQVGCAYGCTFCATALMGAGRNLTAAEIVSQVFVLRGELRARGWLDSFNLVFMGMGEPLANYDALVRALGILQDPGGMAIGRRRITVSTVGLPHRIRKLAEETVAPRLAFSLVSTRHEDRKRLMPVEKRYPIPMVIEALKEYREKTGQRVTLEYVLMKGINDSKGEARALARLAKDAGAKINVIAFNPHPGAPFQPSPPERMDAFLEILQPLVAGVTVRYSRGRRIQAACGQLSTAAASGTDRSIRP